MKCEKCGVELIHDPGRGGWPRERADAVAHTPKRCRDRLQARLAEAEGRCAKLEASVSTQTVATFTTPALGVTCAACGDMGILYEMYILASRLLVEATEADDKAKIADAVARLKDVERQREAAQNTASVIAALRAELAECRAEKEQLLDAMLTPADYEHARATLYKQAVDADAARKAAEARAERMTALIREARVNLREGHPGTAIVYLKEAMGEGETLTFAQTALAETEKEKP